MRKWYALLALIAASLFGLKYSNSSETVAMTGRSISPPPAPAVDTQTQSLVTAFDAYFRQAMQEDGAPGAAVVIVRDSSVVFCKGYGVKTVGSSDSVDTKTVFRVGSLSKGFAAVLTGMLVQDHQLAWTDKVVDFFPEFNLQDPAQAKRIELTHLLSHTTGLPYHTYTNLIEQGKTIPEIVRYFPQVPLTGKEGTLYSYQNAAFSCIEEVIRKATGKSYQDQLRDLLFRRAGMTHASDTYAGMMQSDNRATPHLSAKGGWRSVAVSKSYYNAAAAGGVNANIEDMGQWLLLLLGKKPDLIADSTLDEIFRPRVRTENERRIFRHWWGPKEAWYGLGFRSLVQGQDTLIYHAGYVNGFKSELALDRAHHVAICVLFNSPAHLSDQCIPAFFDLLPEGY